MITGASNADIAIIIIDAELGILEQTKRHAFILSLLQIKELIVCVNKMDLVDYDISVFENIKKRFEKFSEKLNFNNITYIPISALKGDNIVSKSENIHSDITLFDCLENTNIHTKTNTDFRLPIQMVIRDHESRFRGFCGKISSGTIKENDEIQILPSNKRTEVKEIFLGDTQLSEGKTNDSVTLTLKDEIDISRGDMIVRPNNLPFISNNFQATICWLNDLDCVTNKQYIIKHSTKTTKCKIKQIYYQIDIETLHRKEVSTLKLNDIGKVELITNEVLFFDNYKLNKQNGNFIIIDPDTNNTVGMGMVLKNLEYSQKTTGKCLWFTGFSGAGKTTIAKELEKSLNNVKLLDGDEIRNGLCKDLEFTDDDRKENIRRISEVCKLFNVMGIDCIVSFISPFIEDRENAKNIIGSDNFIEVFIDCPITVCEERDVKGLYKKVRNKEIDKFTGITSPYEKPLNSDLTIKTNEMTLKESVDIVLNYFHKN